MADRSGSARRPRNGRHRRPDEVLRLQEALLPSSVPLLPHADVAAAYVPGAEPHAVGGDWFDAASLSDGRLVMSVGDVVGSGIQAVAVMGQLRAVLSARLFESAALPQAAEAVEALAGRTSGAFATTLCAATLDPSTGVLDYLTRGHPGPLVLGPDGARRLPPTGDGPLGTRHRGAVGSTRLNLGETVLLFTDGLYERPDAQPGPCLDRVLDVASGLSVGGRAVSPERLCTDLTDELGVRGFADDVTLLAVRYRPAPPALDLELAGKAERLGYVRAAVGDWAEDLGLALDDRRRLVLGVSELVANAVEHGYDGRPGGPVRVHAELTGQATVLASVTDEGTWREPSAHPGDRGRGLSMSAALGLRIELGIAPGGTRATIETPARRALRIVPGHPLDTVVAEPARLTIETSGRAVVHLSGPLTSRATAARLATEVRRVSRNGLVPVDVDLHRVSHLGSAGLAALEALLGIDGLPGVRVVTTADSASAQAMELAGTPFTVPS
ncbi:MAG: SpoIIE family protein phosphatase [Actinobacteria bacterium]|nr:SpoIIE family protein phosphatase [Actinomycetota bacterium]